MNSDPGIGAGNRAADRGKWRTLTREPKAIKELRVQLNVMHDAAQPFLTDAARKAYWYREWEFSVVYAATGAIRNRRWFSGVRLAAVISVITLPPLVGLNLFGNGDRAVRWLTFALSLVAALSTAIMAFFRFGDRWVICRRLSDELMSAGWALVNSTAADPAKAWVTFNAATDAAKSDYNTAYETAVSAAPDGSQRHIDMTAERIEEAVQAALVPPPLVSFSGAMGLSLTNARPTDDADGRRVWSLPRNRECQLTVVVETGLGPLIDGPAALSHTPGLQAWELLEVRGGRRADSVDVEVVVDAPFLEVASTRGLFQCPTTGGSATYESALRATEAGHYDLSVALLSAGRVIQAVPVEIVVAGDR